MSGAELRDQLGENWCVTVLRSDHALSRDLMTARLGTVVTEPVPWDRSMDRFLDTDWDAEPFRAYYLLAPMDPAGRTWVVVEPYGVQAARPEVQAALSRQATTFTLVTNENAFEYSTGTLGNVTARTDLGLEDPADGDRLVRALARLQEDSGVVLDETWWNGRQWLVHSEPVPPPAPPSTATVAPERLALILEAVSTAAHQVGLDERADVVTALDAMVQIGQLDPSRRSGRAKLVKRAQRALTTLSYALWDAHTGAGDLGSLQRGRGRPGAPRMEDDPLWHQLQLGEALQRTLDLHARSRGSTEDEVLLHLRNALPDTWQTVWPP